MEGVQDRKSMVGNANSVSGLTYGNLTAICMALYTECKIGHARQEGQGMRLTTPQFHILLVLFVSANKEVPAVDVPTSRIRFGGPPSVGSKTASTISGQGYSPSKPMASAEPCLSLYIDSGLG